MGMRVHDDLDGAEVRKVKVPFASTQLRTISPTPLVMLPTFFHDPFLHDPFLKDVDRFVHAVIGVKKPQRFWASEGSRSDSKPATVDSAPLFDRPHKRRASQ
jgi:hypothetical protein